VDNQREKRINIVLPVQIWVTDSDGQSFTQAVRTVQISKRGASLEGVTCVKQVGEILTLQHRDKKARFRVMWVGQPGSPREDKVGIRCLEPSKFSWDVVALPLPSSLGNVRRCTDQRREHVRYGCAGTAALRIEVFDDGALSDISLGGCYIATKATLPTRTPVVLMLTTNDVQIWPKGMVQQVDPGVGMGITFTEISPEDEKTLHKLIHELANFTGPKQIFKPGRGTGVVYC
jgi:hypothetical protein